MRYFKMIPVVALSIGLAACGTALTDDTTTSAPVEGATNGSSEGTETSGSEARSIVLKEEAAFVGQVDSNSIEVNTELETLTLQVGDVTYDWSSIEKNAPVIIEYYMSKTGQHVLSSIEVKEAPTKKEEKKDYTKETFREEGAFVGQVDTNSIEVNTESKTINLQVANVQFDWSTIVKNSPVIIEYYKNGDGQYILTSIDVQEVVEKEEPKQEITRVEAAYVGQIDVNTIEVNTEFETLALKIGEEVKNVEWDEIEKNAHVIVSYYKNESGQHVLTKIEFK